MLSLFHLYRLFIHAALFRRLFIKCIIAGITFRNFDSDFTDIAIFGAAGTFSVTLKSAVVISLVTPASEILTAFTVVVPSPRANGFVYSVEEAVGSDPSVV